ncbi:MAG TPA: LysR family transcriptional regulator [Ramlibacter sp.]|nr:LysR family transcriptional regulator [Ramlibacter sp.]
MTDINFLDDERLASLRLSDLRLIRVLLQEGTVTAAAQRLRIGQSSLSYALERMRSRVGDALFVRSGNGMVPTPLAERLDAVAARVLTVLDDELAELSSFDPATTRREFRLGVNEMGAITIVPKVVALLAQRAPHARLAPVHGDAASFAPALESGQIELACAHFPQPPGHLRQLLVMTREYVCIARREHPTIGARMTLRQFAQAPQVHTAVAPVTHATIEAQLARQGLRPTVAMSTPHLSSVPFIVALSDLIAVIPRGVFELFWPVAAIKQVEVPMRMPSIDICQYWHPRLDKDPAARFLREVVAEAARDPEMVARGRAGGARKAQAAKGSAGRG